MNSSNNNIYVIKCYLKFIKIVADGMQGSNVLAMLLNNFKSGITQKIIKTYNLCITYFHSHISHIIH